MRPLGEQDFERGERVGGFEGADDIADMFAQGEVARPRRGGSDAGDLRCVFLAGDELALAGQRLGCCEKHKEDEEEVAAEGDVEDGDETACPFYQVAGDEGAKGEAGEEA